MENREKEGREGRRETEGGEDRGDRGTVAKSRRGKTKGRSISLNVSSFPSVCVFLD